MPAPSLRRSPAALPAEPPKRLLELAKHYIRTIGFNAHQLGSYNAFATRTVGEIVDAFDPIVCIDNIYQTCSDVPKEAEITIRVAVRDVAVRTTELEPSECLSRVLDYTAPIFGTIKIHMSCNGVTVWEQEYRNFALGSIPVMVLSKYCKIGQLVSHLSGPDKRKERERVLARHRLDMSEIGGYFIVKGAEKVVVNQERLTNSSVYVFPPDDKDNGGMIGNMRLDIPIICECRSHHVKRNKQEMFSLTFSPVANRPSHVIRVTLPKFKKDFPVFIMLRAMLPILDNAGLTTGQTMFRDCKDLARLLLMFSPRAHEPEVYESLVTVLDGSWYEAYNVWTPLDCLKYIASRCSLPPERGEDELVRALNMQQTILKEMFPHVYDPHVTHPSGQSVSVTAGSAPIPSTLSNPDAPDHLRVPVPPKLLFVLFMIYRLLAVVLEWEPFDDRDHYAIKRIDTCGTLMRSLYRQIMVRQQKELQKQVVLSCKKILRTGGKKYTYDELVSTLKSLLCEQTFTQWWLPNQVQREFSYALATGNWNKNTYPSAASSSVVMKAVSQHYKRSNYISQISEQRRTNLPVSMNSTNTRPRQVHPSQWAVHCIASGTRIMTGCGVSVPIDDMLTGDTVFSCSEGRLCLDTLTLGASGANDKGVRAVVSVQLVDGRFLKCTPDHRLLTHVGWVEAGQLNTSVHRLLVGPDLPQPVQVDSASTAAWTLELNLLDPLKYGSSAERQRAQAFFRLAGFICADGCIWTREATGRQHGQASLGHPLDVADFQRDVALVCGAHCSSYLKKDVQCTTYCITLPKTLVMSLYNMPGFRTGARGNPKSWPEVLFASSTPRALVAEFIAGHMGGDGGTCGYMATVKGFYPPTLGQSAKLDGVPMLIEHYTRVIGLLATLGVSPDKCSIGKPRVNNKGVYAQRAAQPGSTALVVLHIKDVAAFSSAVGFRYCYQKQLKLSIVAAWHRWRSYAKVCGDKRPPPAHEYVSLTDALPTLTTKWAGLDRDIQTLPTYQLPVRAIVAETEPCHVYDLSVLRDHNFIASTIVAHNCAHETPEDESVGQPPGTLYDGSRRVFYVCVSTLTLQLV